MDFPSSSSGASKNYNNAVAPELLDFSTDSSQDFDYQANSQENTVEDYMQTPKIRIVPSIGYQAGLNKQNFDIDLDPTLTSWFTMAHDTFRSLKKCPQLSNLLQKFFGCSPNPFESGLKFFANSPDHNNPKQNSFSYTVLEELSRFKKENLAFLNLELLDDNLKMVAFNFAKSSGQLSALKIIIHVFELKKSKHLFVDSIRELMMKRQYKEAGQFACDLELYNEFEFDEFIIPLILEDKLGIVEEYLDKAVNLRTPTIQFLDNLLDRSSSVPQMCDSYIEKYQLKDVKYDKLNKKPVGKLITRLSKKYGIEDRFTPNSSRHKKHGALHFLIRKNYVERNLNKQSWEEMVRDTVPKDDVDLQVDLIDSCYLQYNDVEESVRWVKYFNVPLERVDGGIEYHINKKQNSNEFRNSYEEDWDKEYPVAQSSKDTEKVHTLDLPSDRIHIIATIHEFHKMIDDLSREETLAFDTEWKPAILKSNEISLIQLATKGDVYLIDVMSLTGSIGDSDWSRLGQEIFNNENILKLGFAQSTDFSMFDKYLPAISIQYETLHSQLDIQELWRKVEKIKEFRFPYYEEALCQNQSLANLVKLCLGSRLDKSNQFSNWGNRPLRKEQITYAALDAYCLFEIYEVIKAKVKEIGRDFTELVNNILLENRKHFANLGKKKENKTKHSKKSRTPNKPNHRNPIT